jgi:DNA polymerase V
VSEQAVKCGSLTEIFEQDIDEYLQLPKSLVGMNPEMMIPVSGDSMIDAGYEEGDLLQVRFGVPYHDLDNVLAMVDGMCTVKTLFTDEQGQIWLVPQNKNYRAIPLSEEQDVKILGVVVGLRKRTPRASARDVLQIVRTTRKELREMRKLSDAEVDECIVAIGPEVRHARQWYAVMRVLIDCNQIAEGDYMGFCQRVERLLPEHGHKPAAKDISRMAVLSFRKSVHLWDELNAPVRGARFNDYKAIAMKMHEMLSSRR